MKFSSRDLPPLYRDFDRSSTTAQSNYLLAIKTELVLLVSAAVVSSYASPIIWLQRTLYGIGAVLLFLSLLVTVLLSRNPFERSWYTGRAAAETIKSLAWKYMTRAAPFHGTLPWPDLDKLFLEKLTTLLRDAERSAALRRGAANASEPITPIMRQIRAGTLADRMRVYLADRVRDQIGWYSQRARDNEVREYRWLAGMFVVQGLAAIGAVAQAAFPEIRVNVSTILAAVATAMLAWSQMKRHRELAQSYSTAAHELGLACGLAAHVSTEDELSQFVNDTESAISREHTMWTARREARP